jgi:signal transduction histidine kinase
VSDAHTDDDGRRRLRHDLRTPLTIVVGFAEVLAADKPITDAARRDYASRIQAAAEELRAMLDDFFEDDGSGA